jgi:putative transposase
VRIFPNGQHGLWHSRGYLPHFESALAIQHVTFHLADSLPADALERIEAELEFLPKDARAVERRKRVEEWIEAGHGSCVLREPEVARLMEGALAHFDGARYRLMEWVIMPNHVHILFETVPPWTVAKVVASWKTWTGRKILEWKKDELARREPGVPGGGVFKPGSAGLQPGAVVWTREYWDRYVRDERHLRQVIEYIHENPVKAGLVKRPEDWEWGSARLRSSGAG